MLKFNPTFNLSSLNGKNGFAINGVATMDYSGSSVSTAGDINGDGVADFIIATSKLSHNKRLEAGSSYVVFGKKAAWNASLELSALNGQNGFVINSANSGDVGEKSVSTAGDVNGDGVSDIIIGVRHSSPHGREYAGSSFVVFGKKTAWSSTLELSTLNGKNGFVINGVNSHDSSGYSVSTAGDVNGDGVTDIIIGAFGASPGGRAEAGSSYVVFGKKTAWSSTLELSTLNGKNGFVINGVAQYDVSGSSVRTVGDVNGDGVADVIIGAFGASPGGREYAGSSYVVFGKKTASKATFELSTLNGKNGFVINGIAINAYSGWSVSAAGDINGDGITDALIGAPFIGQYCGNGYVGCGSSYVVFGKNTAWNASVELSALNGENGFAIEGSLASESVGYSVSAAGDVNRDGIPDVLIGAPMVSSSYVIFGKEAAWDAVLDLSTLNGENGFVINGVDGYGSSGFSVSTAGDINGDGIADILIGAPGEGKSQTGSSYVVFGESSGVGFFSHRTATTVEPTIVVPTNLGLKP